VALELGFVFTRPTLARAFERTDAPLRLVVPGRPSRNEALKPAA
jgi:hypothetical protein